MATAQQGMNPQFAGGNLTIPGYRYQDRFSYQGQQGGWRLAVQSAVSQQTDGNTWLYFLIQSSQASASTITAQQAISKGIARTYLQSSSTIRQLTSGYGGVLSDYQGVTRFRDPSSNPPPNNGGYQYFYVYVVLMNSAGTATAQSTAYRCTFANSGQYTQINNSTGLITLAYQDNITGTIIDTPTQNYVNTLASTVMTGTQSPYQRQVTGVANDGNVYYAVDSASSFTSIANQSAGRTIGQTVATRPWYRATSPNTIGVYPIVLVGDETTYYIWTRGYYGGDKTQLSDIQQNTTVKFDGNYYISQSSDRYWTTYRAQDIVQLPTTTFQVTSTQVQQYAGSSQTMFQVPVQYAINHNTYRWTGSSTSYSYQLAGTQGGYQQTQLKVVNSNSVFSDVGGSQKTLYLWVKYRYQADNVYYYTGESIVVETQADADVNDPSFTNITQAVTSSAYTEDWQTTGTNLTGQIHWTATASSGASVQLSTNNSTFVTGAQGIQRSANQTGYVKLTTGSSTNTAYTATVSTSQAGGASGSFTATTGTSGQQGQQTGGGGTFNYGLRINNSQQTQIITEQSRVGNIIAEAQYSISGSQQSGQLKFSGIDCSQSTNTGIIITASVPSTSPYFVRRSSFQQGILLYPYQSNTSTVTGKLYLVRY